jgi:hypothetical protein
VADRLRTSEPPKTSALAPLQHVPIIDGWFGHSGRKCDGQGGMVCGMCA